MRWSVPVCNRHGIAQFFGCDALPFARQLGRRWYVAINVAAEHHGNPAHPFATDQADFYARRLVGLDRRRIEAISPLSQAIHIFDPSILVALDPGAAPLPWTASRLQ